MATISCSMPWAPIRYRRAPPSTVIIRIAGPSSADRCRVSNRFRGLPKNSLPEKHVCPLALQAETLLGERGMVSKDFLKQLEGYGLTTADIHYHMPDHPKLLQQFVWQEY